MDDHQRTIHAAVTFMTADDIPIAKHALLVELDYSAWANRLLMKESARLTAKELEYGLGASHGSILGTLRHIYYSERVWWKRLRENALPPMVEMGNQKHFQDQPPEPGLHDLIQRWPEVWAGLRAWLLQLSEEDLNGNLCSKMPDGSAFCVSRWKIILHAVNHSTLHRGQIMSMLRTLDHQPPNTDIFSFYMDEATE
jgi:uncharacterized damage-inducible protein DinB